MVPLHDMSHTKGQDLRCTNQLQSVFELKKYARAATNMLYHPSATATTCLTIGASDLAIGGVLEQFQDRN